MPTYQDSLDPTQDEIVTPENIDRLIGEARQQSIDDVLAPMAKEMTARLARTMMGAPRSNVPTTSIQDMPAS